MYLCTLDYLPDRRVTAGWALYPRSVALSACLLACWMEALALDYAHPTDYLTPHVHAGMESLIVALELSLVQSISPTLFRFGSLLDLACP